MLGYPSERVSEHGPCALSSQHTGRISTRGNSFGFRVQHFFYDQGTHGLVLCDLVPLLQKQMHAITRPAFLGNPSPSRDYPSVRGSKVMYSLSMYASLCESWCIYASFKDVVVVVSTTTNSHIVSRQLGVNALDILGQ